MRPVLLILATIAAAGCAGREYLYRPSTASVAYSAGYPSAVYPLPPERPEGEVRVLSFGVTHLEPGDKAPSVPALHTRLLIANNGDAQGWTLDTREVFLEIAGAGASSAIYANSDRGGMPLVTVARGEQRTVDLYFPLPPMAPSADRLPAFDLRWTVQTTARAVAMRTPFQRTEVAPPPDPYGPGVLVAGWGPHWWFHPHYPRAHWYVHAPMVIAVRPPRRVVVNRRPPPPPRPVHVAPAR